MMSKCKKEMQKTYIQMINFEIPYEISKDLHLKIILLRKFYVPSRENKEIFSVLEKKLQIHI